VISSNIKAVDYDEFEKRLEIEFKNGISFFYYLVDEVTFQNFLQSESKGKFYNRFVKGKFPSEKKI